MNGYLFVKFWCCGLIAPSDGALQARLYSQLFCLLKINKVSLIVQQDSVL